jgi:hypothetical protein
MSQEGFIALNPELNNGVEIGMVLKVPSQLQSKGGQERVYSFVKKISFVTVKMVLLCHLIHI